MSEKTPIKKYGIISNVLFMKRQALESASSVLWMTALQAVLAVIISLVKLFFAPVILNQLEMHGNLKKLLLTILLFTVALMLLQFLSRFQQMNRIFGRIDVRCYILGKINLKAGTCSYSLLEQQDFQNVLRKARDAVNSNERATEAIWETLAGILQNGAGFAIYLLFLTEVHPLILLATSMTTAIYCLVHDSCNKWYSENSKEEGAIIKELIYLKDRMQDRQLGKDVRLFNMADWLNGLFSETVLKLRNFASGRERVYFRSDAADLTLGFLRNGIAYAYLLWITLEGNLNAAQFLLYFTAVSGFTNWVSGLIEQLLVLSRQSAEIDAVRSILDYAEPFVFSEGKELTVDIEKEYTLELKDVSFRYPGSGEDILSHINLTLHPGEKLAVVGLNGAGKTTLVKLLCGFYDPAEGAVLLNGVDIREYNRENYYRLFTGVFQEFSILPGEIAFNVSQSVENVDRDKIEEAVKQAGLKKKTESLPEGISTHLGKQVYEDAIELSGGETQRLMLARLLYHKRPVIILDEPTAALDAISEKELYEKYHELTGNCSAVYISHRLASTRFCDRILLIGRKGIMEEGTHEELLALGSKYAELYELQSKWYREGEQNEGE